MSRLDWKLYDQRNGDVRGQRKAGNPIDVSGRFKGAPSIWLGLQLLAAGGMIFCASPVGPISHEPVHSIWFDRLFQGTSAPRFALAECGRSVSVPEYVARCP